MAEAFKYIHASDFHLDEPMRGLAKLPNHLKSILANAPYDAAARVFDLAIAERVDFVLLSGDLTNLESGGPRAAAFLLSQFQKLADKNIHVYWCAGSVDQPDRWPSSIELPDNVVTFSSSIVEQVEHRRKTDDGIEAVATIYGSGYDPKKRNAAEFSADLEDPFPIVLMHGELDPAGIGAQNVRYWALGGRHKPNKLEKTGTVVIYPGTTQSRSPKESGTHGCKICRVDSSGKLRIQSVETDTTRWMPQKVAVDENVELGELKNILGERALKIATDNSGYTVLVKWRISPTGTFNAKIRSREFTEEVTEWLRDEFGRSERGVWTVNLTVDPPENLPITWYEEDTILGEYLRALGRYQSDDSLQINLHHYLPNKVETESMAGISHVTSKRREEILKRAVLVGVEYLAINRESDYEANEIPIVQD